MATSTPTPTTRNVPDFAPRPSWIQGQVIIHENDHGPLSDVLETQGQHLVAQPHTPVFPPLTYETHAFATELAASLSALISRQNRRRLGYGVEAPQDWPIGRTPPKVRRAQKERLRAELRASLEEDSEVDVEATLDTYYPLSPASSASQGTPSPHCTIDSKSAFPPLDNQIGSESDVRGEKRKLAHTQGANGHLGCAEHKREKAAPNEHFLTSGMSAEKGNPYRPNFKNIENREESRGIVHACYDGNGTVEKMCSEALNNAAKAERKHPTAAATSYSCDWKTQGQGTRSKT